MQDRDNLFDIDLPLQESGKSERPTLQVLRHGHICSPRMRSNVAFCVRSAVLKLQDVCTLVATIRVIGVNM